MSRRTAIIAGFRTPFVRSGTVFKDLTAIDLGVLAVRELMNRSGVRGEDVDHLVYGTVVHDPHAPNIAREVGLATLPKTVPAVTVSRACATANQSIADAANLIERGYADVVVAGGSESLTHIPITIKQALAEKLIGARTPGTPSGSMRMPRACTCGSANTSSMSLIGPAGTPCASQAARSAALL